MLNPKLNVDLVASGSGHHRPMRQEIREQLRKQRGIPVYVYDAKDFTLLYVFDSKTYMVDSINIHHKTINDCLDSGQLYLDTAGALARPTYRPRLRRGRYFFLIFRPN